MKRIASLNATYCELQSISGFGIALLWRTSDKVLIIRQLDEETRHVIRIHDFDVMDFVSILQEFVSSKIPATCSTCANDPPFHMQCLDCKRTGQSE